MPAGSLCTPIRKSNCTSSCDVGNQLTINQLQAIVSGAVRQRERAYRFPTRKGQILAGSRTPGVKVPGPPKTANPDGRFASVRRKFWNCFAVFARIGSPVIHAGSKVSHHRLTSTSALGERWLQVNLVPFGSQLVPHLLRKAI